MWPHAKFPAVKIVNCGGVRVSINERQVGGIGKEGRWWEVSASCVKTKRLLSGAVLSAEHLRGMDTWLATVPSAVCTRNWEGVLGLVGKLA